MQPDNTITEPPNTLTPARLREALDRWCEEQPGVIRLLEEHPYADPGYQFFGTFPGYEDEKRWWFFADFNEGGVIDLPVVELKNAESFLALTALAIEHQYSPWLQLAATLPYTGSKTARLALSVMDAEAKLASILGQVQQDLGGRVSVEGGE